MCVHEWMTERQRLYIIVLIFKIFYHNYQALFTFGIVHCECVCVCVHVCVCNACVCVCVDEWVSEKDKSASEFRKQKREMFYTCVLLPGLASICQAPVLNCNRNACWQRQLFQTTCTARSCVIPTVKQASASPRNSVWFAPHPGTGSHAFLL